MRIFLLLIVLTGSLFAADEPTRLTSEQIEFFENQVRPLLVENCFECHSSNSKKLQGGLKLDSRVAAIKGGDSGAALVPGDADKSLIIDAVRWKQFEMPPKKKLSAGQIATLSQWVTMGAPWPMTDESAVSQPIVYDWPQLQSQHWAWRKVQRPAAPSVKNHAWVRNEIDLFVLRPLEANGLVPAKPASPQAFVRRVYFDLIGLPPSPDKIDEFVAAAQQDSDAAVETLIEELLASRHYGERWGRHWLDVARYSDGFGGALDGVGLPNAWRYRDWVVDALNADMPIDQFIRMQIAGDQMDPPQAVATGFLALGPTYISDGGDPDSIAQAMSETLADRVDTLTRGLLGLTAACARCHDHKFDPIPQLDYYSIAGVFRNTGLHEFPLAPTEVVNAFRNHQTALRELEKKIAKLRELAKKQNRELTDDEKNQLSTDEVELENLKKSAPAPYPFAHTISDTGMEDMPLAIRGNLRKPGPTAPRRFLRIVAGESPPHFTRGSGRLDLAEAIVSRENPLTQRVFVNRIWWHHFGQGLVRTPSNFGKLGEPPTHPELLDWLTAEFLDKGWSLKRLHRLILSSSTYRMSSEMNPAAFAIDGDNIRLWRMTPRRLDVEAWRDAFLCVTDELDRTLGGPSVNQLLNSPRRTMYGSVSRNGDHFASESFLRLFDFPSPRASDEGRKTSVVPQQSLFLINSPFMAARSRALVARLHRDASDDMTRLQRAYQLLYGRAPSDAERQLGQEYLGQPLSPSPDQLSRWEQYAQVLLSANEFMYIP